MIVPERILAVGDPHGNARAGMDQHPLSQLCLLLDTAGNRIQDLDR